MKRTSLTLVNNSHPLSFIFIIQSHEIIFCPLNKIFQWYEHEKLKTDKYLLICILPYLKCSFREIEQGLWSCSETLACVSHPDGRLWAAALRVRPCRPQVLAGWRFPSELLRRRRAWASLCWWRPLPSLDPDTAPLHPHPLASPPSTPCWCPMMRSGDTAAY